MEILKEMELDKNSPIPLYFQLKKKIELYIQENKLDHGHQLPSERELSEYFNISRPTIRKDFNQLVHEDIIYRKKGKGTYVAKTKKSCSFIPELIIFDNNLYQKSNDFKKEILVQEVHQAKQSIASNLNMENYDRVIFIEMLYFLKGQPVVKILHYLPYHVFPGLENKEITKRSLYRFLSEKYNVKFNKLKITLKAVASREKDRLFLEIEKENPVYLVKNITYDINGRVVDYFESSFRGDNGLIQLKINNGN